MAHMLKTPGLAGGDAPRWGVFDPWNPVGPADAYSNVHNTNPYEHDYQLMSRSLGELALNPTDQTPIIIRINA